MKPASWIATALLVAAAFSTSAATGPTVIDVWLVAEVDISPEGRVTSLEWKSPRKGLELLEQRFDPQVREWKFEPGAINGVPQATRTHLTLKLLGEETGSTMRFRLAKASTGARIERMPTPVYPLEAMRARASAYLVVDLSVSEDGKATVESIDYRSGPTRQKLKFEAAVRKAISHATYDLEQVGDRPVATRLQTTVEFCSAEGCPEHDAIKAGPGSTPPGEAIALESAARLLDDVATPDG